MMNHCAIQQKNVCEEMVGRESLVRPKPVRVGEVNYAAADSITTSRWNLSHQTEVSESVAGTDLLDILLPKGSSHGLELFCTELDSSQPFFSGSPPIRVSNPLIQDARFNEERLGSPVSRLQLSVDGLSSPSPYARKGGYTRHSFGNNPVVRIDGFACMNGGGRNSTVSAHS